MIEDSSFPCGDPQQIEKASQQILQHFECQQHISVNNIGS